MTFGSRTFRLFPPPVSFQCNFPKHGVFPFPHLIVLTLSKTNAGLRYEDLLNEGERDIAEAMSLADPEVITGRTRRIKRALDLGFKRKNLQDYAPDMELDMYKSELYETVEKIRARDQEYALLNAHNK